MKVGEYARTDNGYIGKIIEIEYVTPVNAKHRYIYVLDNDITICYEKEDIIKSSPNIIDLIEVGDYVNGYQVIEKPYMYHDIQFVSVDTQDSWSWGKGEMPVENIKSIVTKEQFESMEYKVGD